MADTTKNATNNAKSKKKVVVHLPRLAGQNAIQEEFFSVNGRNYRIKRGLDIEVPEEVAEVIRNNRQAEEYAMNYVDGLVQKEADKMKELTNSN